MCRRPCQAEEKGGRVMEMFGEAARRVRVDAGIGMRELARRLGRTVSYVSYIETGKRSAPAAIADAGKWIDAIGGDEDADVAARLWDAWELDRRAAAADRRTIAALIGLADVTAKYLGKMADRLTLETALDAVESAGDQADSR